MTIVCATDFSDSSFAAVKVAAQLARSRRAPLALVSVIPHPASLDAPRLDALRTSLGLNAAALRGEGLVVNAAVAFGSLGRAAREVCAAQRASLLVVGGADQTFGPLVVGPLDRFADGVGVPVLVVRDARPFAAWASGAASLKVTIALDRIWSAAAACAWIVRLAAYGAIDLIVSYLWRPKNGAERSAALVQLRLESEAAFSHLPSNVKLTVRLQAARSKSGPELLALASANRADVFVLGTHPHQGPVGQQWSVSHEALALAPMSVACVPDPADPQVEWKRAA